MNPAKLPAYDISPRTRLYWVWMLLPLCLVNSSLRDLPSASTPNPLTSSQMRVFIFLHSRICTSPLDSGSSHTNLVSSLDMLMLSELSSFGGS